MALHSNKSNSFTEEFHKLRRVFWGNNSLTKYKQSISSTLETLLLWIKC